MTAAEFERVADQFGSCELVRGEVNPLAPAGFEHGENTAQVTHLLKTWATQSGLGRVLSGEIGLITEQRPDTVRGADVIYCSYSRLPRKQRVEGFGRIAPELVVEIVGNNRNWTALLRKAGEYFDMGVDRVWIVDPKRRRLCVLRPDDEPMVLSDRQIITDPATLPGFRCRVREFFV